MTKTHLRKINVTAPTESAKSHLDFKVKLLGQQPQGAVTIEGWANPATVDRGGEIVDPEHWDLDNFKKNPVLLYNHGKDPTYGMMPIGRVTDIEANQNGLYAKAQLSNSDDPKIKLIRDLVSEGILRTFSVGFNPGEETKNVDGSTGVAGGQLMELSVVTIPMHQDAIFSLSSKDYAGMKSKITGEVLKSKGAMVASAIENRLGQQVQEVPNFERDQAMSDMATMASCTMADIQNVLSGETLDVPDSILKAASTMLGLDLAELKKLNDGDVKMAEKKPKGGPDKPSVEPVAKASLPPLRSDSPVTWVTDAERAPKPIEEQPDANAATPPASGPGVIEDQKAPAAPPADPAPAAPSHPPAPGAGPSQAKVQAVMVPKEGNDQQAAQSMVEGAGWSSDQMIDDEEGGQWVFVQNDPGDFDLDSMTLMDMGNGCMAQIGLPAPGKGVAHAPHSDTPVPPPAAAPVQEGKPDPKHPPAKPDPAQADKPDPKDPPAPPKPAQDDKPAAKKKDAASAELDDAAKPGGLSTGNTPTSEVAVGNSDACASCIAREMASGVSAGQTHSDNKAIALSRCKTECGGDKDAEGYGPEQLDSFADGWQTAHDQIKAGALSQMASQKDMGRYLELGKFFFDKEKQAGQVPGPAVPVDGGGSPSPSDGMEQNPFLEQARQTNVLLGTLISKFDELSQKLDGLASDQDMDMAEEQTVQGLVKSLETNQNSLNAAMKLINDLRVKTLGA